MDYLVTGTNGCLGLYLSEQYPDSIKLYRSNAQSILFSKLRPKVIIHCAANKAKTVYDGGLYSYYSDNIKLTDSLCDLNPEIFVFISSIDIYPYLENRDENNVIDISQVKSLYAITKIISESIVKNKCKNFIILRCSSLLGKYNRPTGLNNMINGHKTTLSKDSEFNFVLDEYIFEAINLLISNKAFGIYNVCSSKNIRLQEVGNILNFDESLYGDFRYSCGNLNNRKIASICDKFNIPSLEVLNNYLQRIKVYEKSIYKRTITKNQEEYHQ